MSQPPLTVVNTQKNEYGTLSDAELVTLSKRQDDKAFRELVSRYGALIYTHCYRMTQNTEHSEELTQEIFVKVYKNLNRYDTARPLKPWLMRIAGNAAISFLRRQRPVVSINALEEDSGFDIADNSTETAVLAETRIEAEEIFRLMQDLDPKYRHALILRYCDDLPYEEIAEAMDVPVNTIRTWLKRGKEKLIHLVQKKQAQEKLS